MSGDVSNDEPAQSSSRQTASEKFWNELKEELRKDKYSFLVEHSQIPIPVDGATDATFDLSSFFQVAKDNVPFAALSEEKKSLLQTWVNVHSIAKIEQGLSNLLNSGQILWEQLSFLYPFVVDQDSSSEETSIELLDCDGNIFSLDKETGKGKNEEDEDISLFSTLLYYGKYSELSKKEKEIFENLIKECIIPEKVAAYKKPYVMWDELRQFLASKFFIFSHLEKEFAENIDVGGKRYGLDAFFPIADLDLASLTSRYKNLKLIQQNQIKKLTDGNVNWGRLKTALEKKLLDKIPFFWKKVKDLLKEPKYAHLSKIPISIKKEGEEVYNRSLEPLFLAAKNTDSSDNRKWYELKNPNAIKTIVELQLVSKVLFDQHFKPALQTMLLDVFWSGIKDELKKTAYSGFFSKNFIEVDGTEYDLAPLFAAAKDDTQYEKKGSELPTATKNQLQELADANITPQKLQIALKTALDLEKFWENLKSELKKDKYKGLTNFSITVEDKKDNFTDLFSAAKSEKKISELAADERVKLRKLFKSKTSFSKLRSDLELNLKNQKLDDLWSEIKDELKKPQYSDFEWDKKPIMIETRKTPELTPEFDPYFLHLLFESANENKNSVSELKAMARFELDNLVNNNITAQNVKDALANTALDFLWSKIKSELKTKYANLAKIPIRIEKKDYDLDSLFIAAQNEVDVAGSELKTPGAKTKLQELINENITYSVFQTALENRRKILNEFWSGIKDIVQGLSYIHPVKDLISIRKNNVEHKVSLEILFKQKGDLLEKDAVVKIWELVKLDLTSWDVSFALANAYTERLNIFQAFWEAIKFELKKPEYAHLVNLPISIEGKLYNLELLFAAASKDLLGPKEFKKLSELVQNKITSQQFKNALAKTALDLLWSGIKDELQKPEYAHLSKTPIGIKEKDYNLELLFVAAKDDAQYRKEGSQLPNLAKDKLQELVNDVVIPQKLKDTLDAKNNEKLDTFWSDIKDELKKPKYAHLSKTPIGIDGTDYNPEVLFTAAKDDTQYRKEGSQLPNPAKDKLQELVNANITAQKLQNALDLEKFWNELKEELRKDKYSFLVEHSQIPIPVKGATDATFDLSSFFQVAKDNVAFAALSEKKKSLLQTWVNVHSIAKIEQGLSNLLNSGQILWEQLSFLYPFVVDQDSSSEETSIELLDCDGNIFSLDKETGKGKNEEDEDISLFSTLLYYGKYSELSKKEKEIFENLIKECIIPEKVAAYKKPYVMWDELRQFLASKFFIFSHLEKEFAENIDVGGKRYGLDAFFPIADLDLASLTSRYKNLKLIQQNQIKKLTDGNVNWGRLKTTLEKKLLDKIPFFWKKVKDLLKEPKYAHLSKIPISIKKEGEEVYNRSLEALFLAAKNTDSSDNRKWYELKNPNAIKTIVELQLVSKVLFDQHFKPALQTMLLDVFWSGIKDELKKTAYSGFFSKNFIEVDGTEYDLAPLFAAAKDDTQYEKKGSELPTATKNQLQELADANITPQKLQNALKTALDLEKFWENLKSELKKDKYKGLTNFSITVEDKKDNFTDLFSAAKSEKKISELVADERVKLRKLFKSKTSFSKLISDLELNLKNQKLDELWSEIKDELKKPQYSDFEWDKKPIMIETRKTPELTPEFEPYFLDLLFKSANENKNSVSELKAIVKFELQNLVNNNITAQKLKDALANTALDLLWSEIKSELKTKYAHLSKTLIKIDGTNYDLKVLFAAAKDDAQYRKEGSQLPNPAKNKLQELVNDIISAQKLKDTLDVKNSEKLDFFWSNIKDELKKSEYAHLSKIPITVDGTNYNLEVLFTAAKDDIQYRKEGSQLPDPAKDKLQGLVNAIITVQKFKDALDAKNNEKLDTFWTNIKDELKKPKYVHLSKTPIGIDGKEYDLDLLFAAAKDDVEYAKEGSELPDPAKDKLQGLVNAIITVQKFKDALDAKNNEKLDTFWTNIKDELKKPKYAHLSKTPIGIDGTNYNLEVLFAAAKDDTQYEQKGSELLAQAKDKLQELVNAIITVQKFKDALDVKNNGKLDAFWTNIKDELQKPEYAHLSKTPIGIDGTNYNLEPLFTAAKDDAQYGKKGSELLAQAKDKLQGLVNANITAQKLKDALDVKNNEKLDAFWSDIKDELKKPEYANLAKIPIRIGEKDYDLDSLFIAAQNEVDVAGSELTTPGAKTKLQQLINENITYSVFQTALENRRTMLNDFWLDIKDWLERLLYIHPVKDLISIKKEDEGEEVYKGSLEILFKQKSDILEKDAVVKIWELVKLNLTSGNVQSALVKAYQERSDIILTFWEAIKDELKKPKYAHLANFPILIEGKLYNLELLFADASKDDLTGTEELKKKSELVQNKITSQQFKNALENTAMNLLWSGIKNELQKPEYAHLSKTPITVDETDYDLEVLFTAAKDDTQYRKEGSQLPNPAKNKLQELVDDVVIPQKFRDALDVKNNEKLDTFWINIKDELQKSKYAHLVNLPISIDGTNYNLEPLFAAAKDDTQYRKEGSQLPNPAKNKLQELVNAIITVQKFKDALANTALDLLWSGIKDELKKPEYAHLSKTPITIEEKEYKLELLFAAAKDDTQYKKRGSELPTAAKNKLQELVDDVVIPQKLRDALDLKNNEKLDTFWTNIKDELQKPEYANLAKTPIRIGEKDYDLESLFIAAQNEVDVAGSELNTSEAKTKLQQLINENIAYSVFQTALENHRKILNNFWLGIKDELQKSEYAHLVNLLILIKGKLYNLELLFAAASKDLLGPEEFKKLSELVQNKITSQQFKDALAKTAFDLLWSGIKDELKKPEYTHLSKIPISIEEKEYDLELLFAAAKDDVQYAKEDSELPAEAKNKLQELVDAVVISQKLKDALDVKNNEKLDTFWTNIKDELQKSKYAHLVNLPISIDGTDYNLEPLFAAAKDDTQYEKKGSELPASEKNKLQELVNAIITAQKLKDALDEKKEEKEEKDDQILTVFLVTGGVILFYCFAFSFAFYFLREKK